MNCCGTPAGTLGDCGLITIDTNCAAVTATVVEPEIDPEAAVMLADPAVTPVTFLTVTEFMSEDQSAEEVSSCMLPSVKVPVAVNCSLVPAEIEEFAGVTAIEISAAAVTVSVVEPLIEPDDAVIVEVPAATLVAKPWVLAAGLMVATDCVPEPHCTVMVRF